jgi:hypothetical protein
VIGGTLAMRLNDKVIDIYDDIGLVVEIKYNSQDPFNIGVLFNGKTEITWMCESDLAKLEVRAVDKMKISQEEFNEIMAEATKIAKEKQMIDVENIAHFVCEKHDGKPYHGELIFQVVYNLVGLSR